MTDRFKDALDALWKCYVPNGMGSNSLHHPKCYRFIADNITTLEDALTLAAYEAAKTNNGWMPIDTAPKDGTLVIISGGIAAYRENKTYPKLSCWYSVSGFPMVIAEHLINQPTHWMPLPEPPAARLQLARQKGGV